MSLSFYNPIFDICYVSKILTVGSELVISFFKKGKLISLGLPFCNFVRNTIYVLGIEIIGLVVLARYLQSTGYNLMC